MYKYLLILIIVATCVFSNSTVWDYTQKGKAAYSKGEYEQALENFDAALKLTPSDAKLKYNKALALAKLNKFNQSEKLLDEVNFTDSKKQLELLRNRGVVAENYADGMWSVYSAAQSGATLPEGQKTPTLKQVKSAYSNAINKYAQALELAPKDKEIMKNIQSAAYKLASLPDEEENQDNNDENKDNENKDDENKDDENKDDENKDDENKDDENKDDENKDDENKDDENKEQEQEEPETQEQMDASKLIEQFADDAQELHRPPQEKGFAPASGKAW